MTDLADVSKNSCHEPFRFLVQIQLPVVGPTFGVRTVPAWRLGLSCDGALGASLCMVGTPPCGTFSLIRDCAAAAAHGSWLGCAVALGAVCGTNCGVACGASCEAIQLLAVCVDEVIATAVSTSTNC